MMAAHGPPGARLDRAPAARGSPGRRRPRDARGLLPAGTGNGIGDACECGDGSNDGRVNLVDALRLAHQLAGKSPGVAAPQKCHVLPSGPCGAPHLLRLRQAIAGNPSGVVEACPAYTGVALP